MKIAVSNASPLILLCKISELELLFSLFDQIYIPKAVYEEAVQSGMREGHADANVIEEYVKNGKIFVKETTNDPKIQLKTKNIHSGEIEAIKLALSLPGNIIILDDEEARLIARNMNLEVKGTIGIVIECKKKDIIDVNQAMALLKKLNQIMYLSADVYEFAMEKIREE
ncbi:MAG: hypothetical protein ACFFCQ_14660 [Promethearchaeota archaeon]